MAAVIGVGQWCPMLGLAQCGSGAQQGRVDKVDGGAVHTAVESHREGAQRHGLLRVGWAKRRPGRWGSGWRQVGGSFNSGTVAKGNISSREKGGRSVGVVERKE